jgi:RNA polymerase sigma-70 factor (ECF subfamily)
MAKHAQEAERWLTLARDGSSEALGQALEACRGYLLLIARQQLADDLRAKAGASDLVQQTFLEAQRDFGQFQGKSEAQLLAWLRRLLLNNLATFARDYRETAKRAVGREVMLPASDSRLPSITNFAANVPSPSTQAIAHEQADAMRHLLDRLPEDYRIVLLLRHQEELSFEDIGKRMNRTANAARKLWVRALELLQQKWDDSP